MSKRVDFTAMWEEARSRDTYWTELAIIEFTEELCRCMETQGITRADLARRMNVSPAFITKILRGNSNFTLETMTKLARAVGSELRLHLEPEAPCRTGEAQPPVPAGAAVASAVPQARSGRARVPAKPRSRTPRKPAARTRKPVAVVAQ
jgi:transcriptional regulator with XRE-family HTH domain